MYNIDGVIAEAIWPEIRDRRIRNAIVEIELDESGTPLMRLASLTWVDGDIEPFPGGNVTAIIQSGKINESEILFEGLDGDPEKVKQSLAYIIKDLGLEAIQTAYRQGLVSD